MATSRFIMGLALALSSALPLAAKEKAPQTVEGFVNFEQCATSSLRGKKERDLLEKQKNEMEKVLKDLEAQANETHRKLSDEDYLDTQAPQAIDNLKQDLQKQVEEIKMSQNKYYQILQQAQGRMQNVLHNDVRKAAEKVAKDRHLKNVLPAEVAFFYDPELDVTKYVLEEMDHNFTQESK